MMVLMFSGTPLRSASFGQRTRRDDRREDRVEKTHGELAHRKNREQGDEGNHCGRRLIVPCVEQQARLEQRGRRDQSPEVAQGGMAERQPRCPFGNRRRVPHASSRAETGRVKSGNSRRGATGRRQAAPAAPRRAAAIACSAIVSSSTPDRREICSTDFLYRSRVGRSISAYAPTGSSRRIRSTRLTASTNVGQSRADRTRMVLMMLAMDN